jgi:hypothetical protein
VKPFDEEQELTRLLAQEQAPSSLAALRDHGPDAAELASLASRLALQGLDVSVSQLPPARGNPWKKWGWGGLGGLSAVVVWLALRGSQPVPPAAQAVATTPKLLAASAASAEHATLPPRASNVAASRPAPGEGPTAGAEDRATATASVVAPAGIAAPNPLLELPKSTTAATGTAGDVHDSVNSPAHPTVVRPLAAVAASVAQGADGSAPASGSAAVPSELELLRDARLLLRQSPARALELTDEHGRLYPQGKMTQERELIAVSALVALGRRAGALSRAASFERQYPTSPYRKQMGDLLR